MEYIVTTVWSLGICISGYQLELPKENKEKMLKELLNIDFPLERTSSIPSMVFSISCFFPEGYNPLVS